jgi:hypothetical protein
MKSLVSTLIKLIKDAQCGFFICSLVVCAIVGIIASISSGFNAYFFLSDGWHWFRWVLGIYAVVIIISDFFEGLPYTTAPMGLGVFLGFWAGYSLLGSFVIMIKT